VTGSRLPVTEPRPAALVCGMSQNTQDTQMSVLYSYVRSRQLEGTYPGSPETGVWPITAMRVGFGWGWIFEREWSRDQALGWPPSAEPPGLDQLAKQHRINHYFRVRTLDECKHTLAFRGPVLASFAMSEEWYDAPNGVIPGPSESTNYVGAHSVLLVGYDDTRQHFNFMNSWGAEWGDEGFGYLSYATFEALWDEGWFMDLTYPDLPQPQAIFTERTWGFAYPHSSFEYHCVELTHSFGERVGWALAVRREDPCLEVEELFVRPQFRNQGHGKRLIEAVQKRAVQLELSLRLWISYADTEPSNLAIVDRLITPLGLRRSSSNRRWAPMYASLQNDQNIGWTLSRPASRPSSPFSDISTNDQS
jgi:GNAT superfamily N-acetyltransferase